MSIVIVVLSLLALLLLPFSSSAASKKPVCGIGVTILANQKARIYKTASKSSGSEQIFGCLAAGGHFRKLSPTVPEPKTRASLDAPFVIAAPWIAGAGHTGHGVDSFALAARAVNLRTGAIKECSVGNGNRPGDIGKLSRIALTATGDLAWSGEVARPARAKEVVVCDSAGRRVLDSGDSIELKSLQLRGSKLSWSNAGVSHHAVLN